VFSWMVPPVKVTARGPAGRTSWSSGVPRPVWSAVMYRFAVTPTSSRRASDRADHHRRVHVERGHVVKYGCVARALPAGVSTPRAA
jgi:hypothetical protein